MGWALLAFASNLPFASSALSLVRQSAEAVISYHAPSAKSMRALPYQLTVTTRPTLPSKRFSSGRAGFTVTNWSVHSACNAAIFSGDGVNMVLIPNAHALQRVGFDPCY